MGIKTIPQPPYSLDLAPCDFTYSLSSDVVVMRQLRRWRGCVKGHWHAHTRGLRWGLPEVVGTVQQVHCSRGSFMCILSIKVPIRKKSGNLFNDPHNSQPTVWNQDVVYGHLFCCDPNYRIISFMKPYNFVKICDMKNTSTNKLTENFYEVQ